MTRHCLLAVAALVGLAASGCGPGRPELVPAGGIILYQGQPVEQASVTFVAEQGRPATGVTDAQGRFRLGTFEPNDGAVPGKHAVTITKRQSVASENTPGAKSIRKVPSTLHPGEVVLMANFLPDRYGDPQHSGLEVTVTPDGPNDFTLDLTD